MEKSCENCKHKQTSGEMVHPCFPCLNNTDMFGNVIDEYSYWVDENKTWEQIEEEEDKLFAEMDEWIKSDPEAQKILNSMAEIYLKMRENKL